MIHDSPGKTTRTRETESISYIPVHILSTQTVSILVLDNIPQSIEAHVTIGVTGAGLSTKNGKK